MSKQQIEHEASERKYFTIIPNLVDDSNLDPYQFRLLVHYYRVGNCWEGTRTTAEKCGMSVGSVVKKRRELAAAGWIRITEPESETDTIKIVVLDKWSENMIEYTRSPDEHPRSPHERKKNPIKKNNKNTYTHAPAHELSPEDHPNAEQIQKQQEFITALSAISKETYVPGFTDGKFNSVAQALIALGVTPDQVDGFGGWWKDNGYYNGRPSLKTIANEWKDYKAGVTKGDSAKRKRRAGPPPPTRINVPAGGGRF